MIIPFRGGHPLCVVFNRGLHQRFKQGHIIILSILFSVLCLFSWLLHSFIKLSTMASLTLLVNCCQFRPCQWIFKVGEGLRRLHHFTRCMVLKDFVLQAYFLGRLTTETDNQWPLIWNYVIMERSDRNLEFMFPAIPAWGSRGLPSLTLQLIQLMFLRMTEGDSADSATKQNQPLEAAWKKPSENLGKVL